MDEIKVCDLGHHVVWCPKCRRPVLDGPVGVRCDELVRVKCIEHNWEVVALEVMADHVRLVVKAGPKDSPSYVANQLKGAHVWAVAAGVSVVEVSAADTVVPVILRRDRGGGVRGHGAAVHRQPVSAGVA